MGYLNLSGFQNQLSTFDVNLQFSTLFNKRLKIGANLAERHIPHTRHVAFYLKLTIYDLCFMFGRIMAQIRTGEFCIFSLTNKIENERTQNLNILWCRPKNAGPGFRAIPKIFWHVQN